MSDDVVPKRGLLYAGASDEDVARGSTRVHPTLRLRVDGHERLTEELVGSTLRVVRNEPVLGLIVEFEDEPPPVADPVALMGELIHKHGVLFVLTGLVGRMEAITAERPAADYAVCLTRDLRATLANYKSQQHD